MSDEYFDLVLELEQRRVDLLNPRMFSCHGERLIEIVEKKLVNDDVLRSQLEAIFSEEKSDEVRNGFIL